MAKVARVVAKVASVVAIVAGIAALFVAPGLAPLFFKIAAVASAVGAVAGTIAQVTAKKPPARGSPNLITIGANQPMPIVLGETYIGGNKVHEVGYGGKVAKVENPYKFEAIIQSGCGPVDAFTGFYADFSPVSLSGSAATGYYAGFLYNDRQLGARPESDALAPNWAGAPSWTSAHKLSGYAAIGLSLKFDKEGKIYASGEPQWGSTIRGVKHYDPRLDSTYPGGSGPQRITDRSTWVYSANPGIVGLTYCYGWFESGKKQGGIGMPVEGIDLARWVEFANVCDANNWILGGVVYEPGSRWDNLKDICAAGGGEPYFDRHLLGVNYSAPRVSLDTITRDDIADEGLTVASGRTWRERLNTIVPKFRSGAHKWEYVPSADVAISEYITDDGEEKREEITWNLVQDKNQVAQLAAYELVNRREIGQIEVHCKPRLMRYTVGDMLSFDLPGTVVDNLDAIIIRPPEIDPESGRVKLTMMGETTSKHDFALGRTSTAPPVPELLNASQLDLVALSLTRPISTQSPEAPPANPTEGHLYIDATGKKYRFSSTALTFGSAPLSFNGDPIYTSGYEDAQDQATVSALAIALSAQAAADAANAAIAEIDDDDVITIREKIEVLIPGAAAFEALYVAVAANATTAGVSITTLNTKRAAWLATLAAISPPWNDISRPSPVIRGSLDTARSEYDSELKDTQKRAIEAMTAAKTPDLTGNFQWDIAGDVAGTVITSLPAYRRFIATLGGVDVSSTTNFALSSTSSSLDMDVNNTPASADRGVVELGTGTTGTGSTVLTATLPGGAIVEKVISVKKTNAIPATGGSSGGGGGGGTTFAQDTTFNNIGTTSHIDISDELKVTSDASGNVRVAVDLYYEAFGGSAPRTPSFKVIYATSAGGSPTNLFAEEEGFTTLGGTEPEAGYYNRAEATFAMGAPSTDYYFKLQGRRSSGSGNISFTGNSFTVRQ